MVGIKNFMLDSIFLLSVISEGERIIRVSKRLIEEIKVLMNFYLFLKNR